MTAIALAYDLFLLAAKLRFLVLSNYVFVCKSKFLYYTFILRYLVISKWHSWNSIRLYLLIFLFHC